MPSDISILVGIMWREVEPDKDCSMCAEMILMKGWAAKITVNGEEQDDEMGIQLCNSCYEIVTDKF